MALECEHLLITGGAGSFGTAFVREILENHSGVGRVTVFSRDEKKHHDLGHELANHGDRLRFQIGDMRDAARLDEVLRGVKLIVHAAAIKHVPAAEKNPFECVLTNVEGAQNLVRAAIRNDVRQIVALSSDKAVSPSTVYGASKLTMERLLLESAAGTGVRVSVVRYANIFGSSGSVGPLFLKLRDTGTLPITDPAMTRFSITMQEGIALVLFALKHGIGGEILVPIAPSYRVGDVAVAVAPQAEHRIIGARPGEKMHEVMFSIVESPRVVRRDKYYVIAPLNGHGTVDDYCREHSATKLDKTFEYNSGDNTEWLTVEDIRSLISSETV